jgi:hypothetical protein
MNNDKGKMNAIITYVKKKNLKAFRASFVAFPITIVLLVPEVLTILTTNSFSVDFRHVLVPHL